MKTNAHLYVMKSPNGTIKLGHSKQPNVRRRQIELQLNTTLKVIHVTEIILNAERVERLAHRLLAVAKKRVGEQGEWFSASVDEAIASIEQAIRIANGELDEPVWPKRFTDRPTPGSNTFSMRLDPDLKQRLQALADADRRSLTNYIELVLERHVRDWVRHPAT